MPIDLREAPPAGNLMFRPKNSTDDRLYNPDQDLAWAFCGLAHVALELLQRPYWESYFSADLDAHGITETELLEGAARFAHVVRDMATDTTCETPGSVFRQHGFYELHPAIQRAILARVGQVVTSAYFKAIRTALAPGDDPVEKLRLTELQDDVLGYIADAVVREARARSFWGRLGQAVRYAFTGEGLR